MKRNYQVVVNTKDLNKEYNTKRYSYVDQDTAYHNYFKWIELLSNEELEWYTVHIEELKGRNIIEKYGSK